MVEGNYTVAANRLNVRAQPRDDAAVLAVLASGDVVTLHRAVDALWWEVAVPDRTGTGYVQRRHLAPLSTGKLPLLPGVQDALWTATQSGRIRKVQYKLGAKDSYASLPGQIDCSGWVSEMTRSAFNAVNALAAPEIVFDAGDYAAMKTHSDGIVTGIERRAGQVLHGKEVRLDTLREGMVIGVNFGTYEWEGNDPPRVYGIDHIVQLVTDPATGALLVSQSSSSGHGVNTVPLAAWLAELEARGLPAAGRVHAADPFAMADRNTRFVRALLLQGTVEPAEPVPPPADGRRLAQLVVSGFVIDVEPQPPQPEDTAATLDEALAKAAARSGCRIVSATAQPAAPFAIYRWFPQGLPPGRPPVIEVAAAVGVQAILTETDGPAAYFPADEPAGKRWVAVPWVHGFYRQPQGGQNTYKEALIARLAKTVGKDANELRAMALPVLRLWMARHADAAFPVRCVEQPERGFRGAQTHGITQPFLDFPLSEPACYLPVIAGREGLLESINAYDLGAGVSLGPIQFNMHGGALLEFLWNLQVRDPELFMRELGVPFGWSMHDAGNGLRELRSGPLVLSSRSSDEKAGAAYFQSGDKTAGTFEAISVPFRRLLAERFRNVVAWPHVQNLIVETSAWWLRGGLNTLNAGGIAALDPRLPDRDTYVLRSILLSAYVRYSGYTRPIVGALSHWVTSAEKLAHWKDAVETALADDANRRQVLLTRMERQIEEADKAFAVVSNLMAHWV